MITRPANYTVYNSKIPIPVVFHCRTTEPLQEQVHFNSVVLKWIWVQYLMAIIEFADGHCATMSVGYIQFTDKKEDIKDDNSPQS